MINIFQHIKDFIHYIKVRNYRVPLKINIWFGIPGSGKTTWAAWLAMRDAAHDFPCWSNIPLLGAYQVTKEMLGNVKITCGRIIWDEAGMDFDNRDFKDNFKGKEGKDLLYFWKYHRHAYLAIDIFSQTTDIDKKIRDLADSLYIVHRSIIPCFVYRKEIRKFIGIDDLTSQLIDKYYYVPFSRKYIYAPRVWKTFDSYEMKDLQEVDFKKWDDIQI